MWVIGDLCVRNRHKFLPSSYLHYNGTEGKRLLHMDEIIENKKEKKEKKEKEGEKGINA